MNVETGRVYDSYDSAILSGESPDDLVEVRGTREQVERLSSNVRDTSKNKRRAANKRARASRKRNR